MKKFYFVAMLLCAGFAFTSCGNDDDTPTPNPEPPTPTPVKPTPKDVTVDFEGDSWAALIDPEQNNGTLLYNESVQYKWSDAKTGLSGWVNGAEDYYHPGTVTYMFWNGGTAISNYVDPAFDTHCSADYQLSVPASNGSKNFVIGFCGWGGPTTITLPEGENRLFKSIDICPTTWLLGSIKGFDGYASKLAEDGSIYLVITGQKAGSEEAAGTVKVAFASENKILETWKNIDLSSLGEINSITFTIESTDSKQPNYFAFDNVVLAGKAE